MRRDKVLLGAAMSCEWTASCSTGLTKALCPVWSMATLKAGTACIVAKNWQSFQASTSEQATWDPWTLLNLLLRPSPVSREHRELALPHWEGGSFNPASHAAQEGVFKSLLVWSPVVVCFTGELSRPSWWESDSINQSGPWFPETFPVASVSPSSLHPRSCEQSAPVTTLSK